MRARRGLGPVVLVALLVVGLAIAAALAVPRLFANDADQADDPVPLGEITATVTPTDITDPTDITGLTTEPEPAPTAVGVVTIGSAVIDARAEAVAAMFDTYFSGINDKDYDQVATVLDPSGSVNPDSADEMAALERGTATTYDSEIFLLGVSDLVDGGLLADVAFRSEQTSGTGPKGRADETCTQWRIAYTLSTTIGYRVVKGKASSQPC